MQIKQQRWTYNGIEKVWVGKYKNSQNLPHWHRDCEVIFVEKGGLNVFCGSETYSLSEGNALYIDTEQVHRMSAPQDGTMLITLIFDYTLVESFAKNEKLCSPLLEKDHGIKETYYFIINELSKKGKYYNEIINSAIIRLVADILRSERTLPKKNSGKTNERLHELLSDVDDNFNFYDMDSAASKMGMNPSYFSRYFHSAVGMPFSQYLNCVRISKATELIQNKNATMTEIADKSGFGTIRNFNRIFKSLTGYSPTNIPEGFVFLTPLVHSDGSFLNPTLSGCELVESSS